MDQKALKILFSTYWTSAGWKANTARSNIAPEDLAYAINAGYMFLPEQVTHDDVVRRVIAIRKTVTMHDASRAFLASLSTRRLDLRSALGTFAVARHFPAHTYQPS